MTVPTVPGTTPAPAPQHAGRALTVWSYLVDFGYLVWFWVMLAAGYWVYSWFDMEPGMGDSLTDAGVLGWLTAVGVTAAVVLPSIIGAWLALRARRAGAGLGATVALGLNVLIVLGYVVLTLVMGV
jgi:hypothetical protein